MPLSVERKTPSLVPAKIFVPLIARDQTYVFVRPELAVVQLVPLFVERKIPVFQMPTNRFVPATAKVVIMGFGGRPLLMAVQLAPLLVERNTPTSEMAANKFVPLIATMFPTKGRAVKPLLTADQFPPLSVER